MKIKVEEYVCLDGSNPYKAWFDNLDPQAAAKIVTAKLDWSLEIHPAKMVRRHWRIRHQLEGRATAFTLSGMATHSSSCSVSVLS